MNNVGSKTLMLTQKEPKRHSSTAGCNCAGRYKHCKKHSSLSTAMKNIAVTCHIDYEYMLFSYTYVIGIHDV